MLWNWLSRTSFSEKVNVLKKYLLVKKLFFWKSSCSEEEPASKTQMFWIFTYSEEVAPPNKLLYWKSIDLQEVADQKKYLLPRTSY